MSNGDESYVGRDGVRRLMVCLGCRQSGHGMTDCPTHDDEGRPRQFDSGAAHRAFLAAWLARHDAADTSVRVPADPFLRRWLTGQAADPEEPG